MKASTLKLIEKLARDVRRGDEICDYNPVFAELFGSLFLELEQCLDIIPYLEATPAIHPSEFGDPRVVRDLNDFWMKRDSLVTWTFGVMDSTVYERLFCFVRQQIEPGFFIEKTAQRALSLVFSGKKTGGKFADRNRKDSLAKCAHY